MPRLSLDVTGVMGRTQDVMRTRMERVTLLVQRAVKQKINVGGTRKFPSQPGEPPHKVSTRLFQSITTRVYKTGFDSILGLVGTKVVYARRLEQGYTGTDKAGRNVHQAPRPFLRPALRESQGEIKRLIGSTSSGGSA